VPFDSEDVAPERRRRARVTDSSTRGGCETSSLISSRGKGESGRRWTTKSVDEGWKVK
jgi:hypothetical protein